MILHLLIDCLVRTDAFSSHWSALSSQTMCCTKHRRALTIICRRREKLFSVATWRSKKRINRSSFALSSSLVKKGKNIHDTGKSLECALKPLIEKKINISRHTPKTCPWLERVRKRSQLLATVVLTNVPSVKLIRSSEERRPRATNNLSDRFFVPHLWSLPSSAGRHSGSSEIINVKQRQRDDSIGNLLDDERCLRLANC